MQFCRIYTGADLKSHFEELDQNAGGQFFLTNITAKTRGFQERLQPRRSPWLA